MGVREGRRCKLLLLTDWAAERCRFRLRCRKELELGCTDVFQTEASGSRVGDGLGEQRLMLAGDFPMAEPVLR